MDAFINFLYAAIISATPLLFGTLGEIITEKVGNLNLGVEGMMWLGAFSGFYVAFKTDSLLLSLVASFAFAALGAALYAFLTITLRANQNVTGLTLTTFGIGIAKVLGYAMTSVTKQPQISDSLNQKVSALNLPFLTNIPYVGKLLFNYNILVYFAVILSVLFYLYFKHTKRGLNVRAVGENPAAADAAGINVTVQKYIHVILGGGICGIGGAYMSLISGNGTWHSGGVVNGYGWIAVALVIFASWNPARAIVGSLIFGMFASLQNYVPASVVTLPTPIYQMLPFLLTTIVLIITSIRKSKENQQPASCGLNYFREER
ncbi:MAG: ABC transporter permease [Oscillospiraceae bacterium]|jgi:simple sugar transport system permease protein|nr:ABC transporter permease [Oscillospiraceae bacterium]